MLSPVPPEEETAAASEPEPEPETTGRVGGIIDWGDDESEIVRVPVAAVVSTNDDLFGVDGCRFGCRLQR
jgi:hypothetical protein